MLTGRAGLGVALDNRIGNRLNRHRQILARVELGGGPRDVVKALLHRVEEEPHEVAAHNNQPAKLSTIRGLKRSIIRQLEVNYNTVRPTYKSPLGGSR